MVGNTVITLSPDDLLNLVENIVKDSPMSQLEQKDQSGIIIRNYGNGHPGDARGASIALPDEQSSNL
ncbi:hypothetical protein VNO78_09854 [Psophocarpus tetragonolobus]|uniref:Uncharacterized protein n=1 Tax=Psophocarpus tetragonolobus TaxID=3891 RepID=A0AAN9T771_PSOTE